MSDPRYRLAQFDPSLEKDEFDCGEPDYNAWLANSAQRAQDSGSARVFVLLDDDGVGNERVVGYFAICPTLVVRDAMPKPMRQGMLRSTPGWLLAKLALDQSLRGSHQQWGRQLLREALECIVLAAELGGGAVIVVDADNLGLVPFYERNGFLSTGGHDLRMFMKLATARAYLQPER